MKNQVRIRYKVPLGGMTFLIMMVFTSYVQAQVREISISEALELSYTNNEKVKQYGERVQQKVNEDKAAKGNFLPSLNIVGGYTYLSDNIQVNTSQIQSSLDDLGGKYGAAFVAAYGEHIGLSGVTTESAYSTLVGVLGQFPEYPNMEVNNQQFAVASLSATQPLFTGGKIIAAKKYAKAELRSADIELIQVKNEIANELIERYLNMVLLKQVVKIRQEVYDGMLKHEEQAARAIQLEILPKHVLLRAKVAVADAKKDLENDLNNVELSAMALRTTMNLPDSIPFTVMDSIGFQELYLDFDELLNTAYAKQPVLGLIGQKEEMAKQALAVEKSNFMPNVAAFGSYNMFRQELPIIPPKFMVGLTAQFNLFNGFKDINGLKASKHLQKEVAFAKEYALKQIHLLIQSNYITANNQQKLYNSLTSTVNMAEENLRINTRRFEEGIGKSIDVIDATLLYKKSKIEKLVALDGYYKAVANLYTAIGEPEKIIPILNKSASL
ncbi:TolC family protein [Cyclobacterium qasimii]|uniref:Type I secretion outer membrane protein n=2 Tax=Cyclobacterium qasimii TaxID=1350429 RepID=S7V8Y0_9BACT|nr:TolC family protein [Cyclobacterium qasimii]EPR66356.1 type I secretion outer membrane protein [Cyclobacterium qasimii M12-11B]GEO21174.1 membrane protein [Cyclobacterium qasimii]